MSETLPGPESAAIPQPPIDLLPRLGELTPELVAQYTEEAITYAKWQVDGIRAVGREGQELGYDNTVGALDAVYHTVGWDCGDAGRVPQLIMMTHPDEDVRKAARGAFNKFNAYFRGIFSDSEVYDIVERFNQEGAQGLEPEEDSLLKLTLREFKRGGSALKTQEEKDELAARFSDIEGLKEEFYENMQRSKDRRRVRVTKDDLRGLPDTLVGEFKTILGDKRDSEGKWEELYEITMEKPHVEAVLEGAIDRKTRERVWRASNSAAMDTNREALSKLVEARRVVAQQLGYPSWAHYRMEDRMAGTPERAFDLLTKVRDVVTEKTEAEITRMQEMLREDSGDPELALQPWDTVYYAAQIRKREYDVDMDEVAKYFPHETTIQNIFELTGELLGLEYQEREDVPTWHPDVKAYAVVDTDTDKELGVVFLDLFPRPGKFRHGATFNLELGKSNADDQSIREAAGAIVMNLPAPSGEAQALWGTDEVQKFTHELVGHALHLMLARTRTERYAGSNVPLDVAEVSSRVAEPWILTPEVLTQISSHYVTGEPIPADVAEKLAASENVDAGLAAARLLYRSIFDIRAHRGLSEVDLENIYQEATEWSGFSAVEGTHWPSQYDHIAVGPYDVGYFSYPAADILAAELLESLIANGMLDAATWRRYGAIMLKPGGSKDSLEMMAAFRGVPPEKFVLTAYVARMRKLIDQAEQQRAA